MRGVRACILAAVLLALPGCASDRTPSISLPSLPEMPELAGPGDGVVTLEVLAARAERGSCLGSSKAFEKECHVVEVRMAMPEGTQGMASTRMSWESAPTSSFAMADSVADRLRPGEEAAVTIRFERAEGSPPITEIQYDGLVAQATADVPSYAPAPTDAELVGLTVQSAAIEPGTCFSGREGSFCHRLQVTVDNVDNPDAMDVGPLAWTATDMSGGMHDFRQTTQDGPSAVAAGRTVALEVSFDLPEGARVASVILEDPLLSITVEADVPSY